LLDVFEGVPQFTVSRETVQNGVPVVDLLAEHTQVFASKGEARRMLKDNGVSINKEKVKPDYTLDKKDIIAGKYILAQKGKKNYFLVILE
jgi:tyrosyl-tRNA synthetase